MLASFWLAESETSVTNYVRSQLDVTKRNYRTLESSAIYEWKRTKFNSHQKSEHRASTEPPISMSSGGDHKGGRLSMYDYYGVPYINWEF